MSQQFACVILMFIAAVPVSALDPLTKSYESASPQTQSSSAATDLNTLRQQGIGAYQRGDDAVALGIFRQVIAAEPSDIVAYNIAGNCSLHLKDYSSAIDYFKHALQLRPDEYHNLSGLIRAYTLAEMTPERDELRKHIE